VLRQTLIRLSQQEQLRELATRNVVARSIARRFVAGETIDDALGAIRELNGRGMSATLDNLGENVSSEEEAREAAEAYCRIIRSINDNGVNCNASLKLTQFGLDLGEAVALDNMRRVMEAAAPHDTFVRIDMESSDYVDRTLSVFFDLWSTHKNVGVVLQSCLYRTAEDLERVIDAGARVRLVKGAYLEPASVAYQDKRDVDENFMRLTRTLLDRAAYPAIGTHDCALIDAAKEWTRERGIEQSRFEFQMLYGIRRDVQAQLVAEGYNLRVYVPFGTHWYPYMMRRMAERPANIFFVLENLAREVRSARS